ncbi:flagellar hook-associated protein 3 [Enterococcus sp. AZ091]|uniref:flagellar hook-associated protein FlgL n=1 Tax=Enterococcus TaxID=1350 RepID=UPI0009BDFE73|nr:flagellar hook-associated protein FlgL [Enterococcus gallinarum]OQO78328.1 flagellar hook-associated protein 3 [Enterococcus gallinarum]
MRISNNITYSDFIRNLGTNASNVHKTLNQLSSLKEVSKSSENPLLISKIMNLTGSINQNATFGSTIKDSISWSKVQDSTLDNVSKSMLRIRSLIQSSANGTNGDDELKANKAEIEEEIEGIVEALNTNYDGRYIFGGTSTTTPPFEIVKEDGEIVGIKYNGTSKDLPREIANGVSVDLLSDGSRLMKETGTETDPENLSTYFNDLLSALRNDDKEALGGKLLEAHDEYANNFVNVRSQIGALYNRLEAASDRNETEKLNLTETLSNKQDIDFVEKYMEFSNQMTAYQSTLAMGTKIMQLTILDYVR